MSTISTDERREVARRLRRIKDTREGCGHELCCDLWSAIFDSDYRCTDLCDECEVAVLNSLADLIEPSPSCEFWDAGEQECYSVRTVRPVDRDALLALADEMDHTDSEVGWTDDAMPHFARRIREALGVA